MVPENGQPDGNPVEQEIDALRDLLAIPVTSRDERVAKETRLLPVLSVASDTAVAALADNRYVWEEIVNRIDSGSQFPLEQLLMWAAPLSGAGFDTKGQKKRAEVIVQGLANSTPGASTEEVVGAVVAFAQTQLDNNTGFLDIIMSFREDMEAIAAAAVGSALERGIATVTDWYVEGLLARARIIRAERNTA